MKEKIKKPIQLKAAQLFLDECMRTREPLWIVALSKDGTLHRYDGWLVQSAWWRAGTHDLLNPANGQIRKVRDVLIFSINGHPLFI